MKTNFAISTPTKAAHSALPADGFVYPELGNMSWRRIDLYGGLGV